MNTTLIHFVSIVFFAPRTLQSLPSLHTNMSFDGFLKTLTDLQAHCSTLLANLTHLQPNHSFPAPRTSPPWARIAPPARSRPMTVEAIEERLEGIPVYALSNASEEFLLVSGSSSGKNLGLFCFNKDDAEALLNQVTLIDPHARPGSKVVPVALNKVLYSSRSAPLFVAFFFRWLFVCRACFFRCFSSR